MAASRSENWRMSRAIPTGLLRMMSSTSRTLYGDVRLWRRTARVPSRSLVLGPGTSAPPRPFLAGVEPEGAGGRELAQLVADHRLGDVDGHVLAAVVDGDGVTDHVGDDRRATRPRLDHPLLVAGVEVVDLLQQVVVDERPLLQTARHAYPYLRDPRVRRRRTMSFEDSLVLSRVRPSGLPHGDTGWRTPDVLPSPPRSGWSNGFMATPRVWGRLPFQRLRPALPILMSSASALPTSPTVPRQSIGTRRISVLGRRRVA